GEVAHLPHLHSSPPRLASDLTPSRWRSTVRSNGSARSSRKTPRAGPSRSSSRPERRAWGPRGRGPTPVARSLDREGDAVVDGVETGRPHVVTPLTRVSRNAAA